MSEILFLVQGSSEEPYKIIFKSLLQLPSRTKENLL